MRGNPHAAFDVAGAGNVAWSKWCDTRRRKGEPTGNTNIDLNRRVSPRPYSSFGALAAIDCSGSASPKPGPGEAPAAAFSLLLMGRSGRGCVLSHKVRAEADGSIRTLCHHAASSPQR